MPVVQLNSEPELLSQGPDSLIELTGKAVQAADRVLAAAKAGVRVKVQELGGLDQAVDGLPADRAHCAHQQQTADNGCDDGRAGVAVGAPRRRFAQCARRCFGFADEREDCCRFLFPLLGCLFFRTAGAA